MSNNNGITAINRTRKPVRGSDEVPLTLVTKSRPREAAMSVLRRALSSASDPTEYARALSRCYRSALFAYEVRVLQGVARSRNLLDEIDQFLDQGKLSHRMRRLGEVHYESVHGHTRDGRPLGRSHREAGHVSSPIDDLVISLAGELADESFDSARSVDEEIRMTVSYLEEASPNLSREMRLVPKHG